MKKSKDKEKGRVMAEKENKELKEEKISRKEEKYKSQCTALEAELEAAKKEAENWKNKYYEAYADLDNTRKSLQRDHEQALKYRAQGFLEELLQPIDNLDMALRFEPKEEVIKNYYQGFKMIYSQFQKVLEDEQVSEINPAIGSDFDANTMHAIQTVEGEEDDKVASIYVKGYFLKDRLVRPAMVVVTKKKQEEVKEEVKEEASEETK